MCLLHALLSVLLLDIISQLNDQSYLKAAPVDHPMLAWKQSEFVFGDLILASLKAWFFGSVGSPEADAGPPGAEASLCPGPMHYILRLMSMTNPHIVRVRVATVDDRFPLIAAPLRTSECEVQC